MSDVYLGTGIIIVAFLLMTAFNFIKLSHGICTFKTFMYFIQFIFIGLDYSFVPLSCHYLFLTFSVLILIITVINIVLHKDD